MSSSAHQHYLAPDDMAKIERVLAAVGSSGAFERLDAASYLTRKFQEGVTEEAELAFALQRYMKTRGAWRRPPSGSPDLRHVRHRG